MRGGIAEGPDSPIKQEDRAGSASMKRTHPVLTVLPGLAVLAARRDNNKRVHEHDK
jgi:hypothetical protein